MLPGHRWGTAPEKKAAPGGGNPSLHIAAGTGAGKFYLAAHPHLRRPTHSPWSVGPLVRQDAQAARASRAAAFDRPEDLVEGRKVFAHSS